MILSHSRKFIFIHVHKTAGTSIDHALAEKLKPGDIRFGPHMLKPETPRRFATETRNSLVTEEQWNSYFKFAFVRNPWDWLVSTYKNIHQSYEPEVLKQNIFIKDKQFILDAILSKLNLTGDQFTFRIFLRDCVLDQRVENPFDYHWKDQHVHICDQQGEIMVDFLGRFEQINQDIEKISDRIGLDQPIPHLNKTTHQNYRNFYDDESRAWVAQRFKRDIELFHYSF